MTVSSQTAKVSYAGNGSTKTFAVPFYFLADSHLLVSKRAADGTRVKSDEAPTITYLGIFETVGQRGVPSALGGMARFFNKRFGFHDMTIGQSVLSARHAVAVDEIH